MHRIALGIGQFQYDYGNNMSYCIKQVMQPEGLCVFINDLEELNKYDFLIAFNNCYPYMKYKKEHPEIKCKIIQILLDHPVHHLAILGMADYTVCVVASHYEFLRTYMHKSTVIQMGGLKIDKEQERDIDYLCPMTILNPTTIREKWEKLLTTDQLAIFYDLIYHKDPLSSYDFPYLLNEVKLKELKSYLAADEYLRNYNRVQMINEYSDKNVLMVGNSDVQLPVTWQQSITNYHETLELMTRSKVVMHCNPNFSSDLEHDRVYNAILNGAKVEVYGKGQLDIEYKDLPNFTWGNTKTKLLSIMEELNDKP